MTAVPTVQLHMSCHKELSLVVLFEADEIPELQLSASL